MGAYNIHVVRIQTNKFVSNIIQNIQIAKNEFVAAKKQIGTYNVLTEGTQWGIIIQGQMTGKSNKIGPNVIT